MSCHHIITYPSRPWRGRSASSFAAAAAAAALLVWPTLISIIDDDE